MKVVIDITEKDYQLIKEGHIPFNVLNVLMNGTPLDKHDEEVIKETVESIWGKPPYIELFDKIRAEIQGLRNCSCSCSDGIIDDVEDIIDKYTIE